MKTAILFLFFCASSAFGACTWTSPSNTTPTACSTAPGTVHNTETVTYTVTCATTGVGAAADIQIAVDDMWRGDIVELADRNASTSAACIWDITDSTVIKVGAYATRAGFSSGNAIITSTQRALLPKKGTRISQIYKPLMPTLRSNHAGEVLRISGTLPPVTNFEVWGLNIQPNLTLTTNYTNPGLVLGNNAGGNYWPGANYSAGPWPMLKLASNSSAGTTTITVAKVNPQLPGNPTDYIIDGMILGIQDTPITPTNFEGQWASDITNPIGGPTVASHTATTITFTTPLKYAHNASTAVIEPIMNDPLVGMAMQPDNIHVHHCVFTSDFNHMLIRWMSVNTRSAYIEDNFIEGPMGDNRNGQLDAQGIHVQNAIGPIYITNNYIGGTGENWMTGGTEQAWNGEVNGMYVRFNYAPKIPQRDFIGVWTLTQSTTLVGYNGFDPVCGNRRVYKGRVLHQTSDGTLGYWRALKTGCVGTSEPSWPASPVYNFTTVTDGTVTWLWVGGNHPFVKNNGELKNGQNVYVQWNVMDGFFPMWHLNDSQKNPFLIKASAVEDGWRPGHGYGAGKSWPLVYRATTRNIFVLNNVINTMVGCMDILGTPSYYGTYAGDYLIKNNFCNQYAPGATALVPYYPVFQSSSDSEVTGPGTVDVPNVAVENNTFYSPFEWTGTAGSYHIETNTGVYTGAPSLKNNILFAGGGGLDGHGGTATTLGTYFPGTANFKNNVIPGVNKASYPAGQVTNLTAASTGGSLNWDFVDGSGKTLFRNRSIGRLDVTNGHTLKRSSAEGHDVGADWSELPRIDDLRVTTTDTKVMLRYNVTNPIGADNEYKGWVSHPGTLEVMTRDDMDQTTDPVYDTVGASYVCEGSDATVVSVADSNGHHRNSDAHDANLRAGLSRMVTCGRTTPLTPSTTYWYRLTVGPVVLKAPFTTAAALSGTTTLNAQGVTQCGTGYSRTTDTISGTAGTVGTNQCTGITKGTLVFFRVGAGQVRARFVR